MAGAEYHRQPEKESRPAEGDDMASLYKRGNVWWVKSYEAGRMVRWSLKTTSRAEAPGVQRPDSARAHACAS
jgi:hypothetical protein